MYCDICGSQLIAGEAYCLECGAPVHSQVIIENVQNASANMQYSNSNIQYPQQAAIEPQIKAKSNKKKILIIAGICIAILVVVFVVIGLLGNKFSPQRKIIDEYFEAINDKDIDAIYEIAYDDEALEYIEDNETDELFFFTNSMSMGFNRGLYEADYLRFVNVVYNTYPNISKYSQEEVTRKTLDMLEVNYEIVDITPFEDFELVEQGLSKEITLRNIEDYANRYNYDTGDRSNVKIDEVYIAQVRVEWYYGNMKYGIDKKWWKDEEFKSQVENFDSFKSYDAALKSFEEFADTGKDTVYILILYRVDDDWHIARANRLGTLETQYEKGRAMIAR